MRLGFSCLALALAFHSYTHQCIAQIKQPDWGKVQTETMIHFQTILRINSSFVTGSEAPVVEYLKGVLEKEGIPTKIFALDPKHPSLVARLKGTGKKKPVLIMGHTDVVTVDTSKWIFPPFAATRDSGYVYGRGSIDDKDNVVSALMVMLLLKRLAVPLDRDVIFLAEAAEEGFSKFGIGYMTEEHWPEIEAEYCFAEGGSVIRTGGVTRFVSISTTEKLVRGVKLVAKGNAGHGSIPLQSNAINHLSAAIAKLTQWQPKMRLNQTTKSYFEQLAKISSEEEATRYRSILSGQGSDTVQQYFAAKEPRLNTLLRTSISPTRLKSGYADNVIPGEAEAYLDIRALPDEDLTAFFAEMKRVIGDPQVEIIIPPTFDRPASSPSDLNTEAFATIQEASKKIYNLVTIPVMLPGGTDMAYLRAKGVQCYGIGPMVDTEDGPKGYGPHGDQERILEDALHKFVQFNWSVVYNLARKK